MIDHRVARHEIENLVWHEKTDEAYVEPICREFRTPQRDPRLDFDGLRTRGARPSGGAIWWPGRGARAVLAGLALASAAHAGRPLFASPDPPVETPRVVLAAVQPAPADDADEPPPVTAAAVEARSVGLATLGSTSPTMGAFVGVARARPPVNAAAPDMDHVRAASRPVFREAPPEIGSGAGARWATPTQHGAPAAQRLELASWSGLQRGRSGLDGGLQVALATHRIRPAVQVGAYRLGVGVGLRLWVLPVTVGVSYMWDLEDGSRRPGVYVSWPAW